MLGFDDKLMQDLMERLGLTVTLTPLQKGMVQAAIDDTTRPLRDRIDTLTSLGIPVDKAAAVLKVI